MKSKFFLILAMLFAMPACQSPPVPIPRPRGFPKVVYPEKKYQLFDQAFCGFEFEYPVYASIQQDTSFFDERPVHPCWFDIVLDQFDARVHCSYYSMEEGKQLEKLRDDAYRMVSKHNMRASYIDEYPVQKPNGVSGFVFNIEGPAASPFQFYLTDSTRHFLRASLYFNTQARPDSLAPVFEFVKADIVHIINTLEWK